MSNDDFFHNLSPNEATRPPSECSCSTLNSPTVSTWVAADAAKTARAGVDDEKEHDELADAVQASEFSTAVRLCMRLSRKPDALSSGSKRSSSIWSATQSA